MPKKNQLRIIGGTWRGRKLSFPDLPGLRPTSDRVRETLFNWLQMDVAGARCLDLFAGSGALGFEALSRGAEQVVFVDSQKKAVDQIRANAEVLKTNSAAFSLTEAQAYLQKSSASESFDIVFLDPPFHQNLLEDCLSILRKGSFLGPSAKVYVESESKLDEDELSKFWRTLKAKTAGNVHYYLLTQLSE